MSPKVIIWMTFMWPGLDIVTVNIKSAFGNHFISTCIKLQMHDHSSWEKSFPPPKNIFFFYSCALPLMPNAREEGKGYIYIYKIFIWICISKLSRCSINIIHKYNNTDISCFFLKQVSYSQSLIHKMHTVKTLPL